MKKSEEINLSEQIKFIEAFAKRHVELDNFYNSVRTLNLISIQDLSFSKDIEFFKELLFILSVIHSIIVKPHLNNRRDEIIARSGEVSNIETEDFQKTLRDSSLWKDKGVGYIIPEHVYYHQYEDELKTYENIFIVKLINDISFIVDQYSSLYVSLLIVTKESKDALVLEDSMQEVALQAVNKLARRINQIKESFFYREVSKAKNRPKVFYPTNILIHDRLYNLCYKFYKKMFVYADAGDLDHDLFVYYFVLIMKTLKEQGYEIDVRNKATLYSNKSIILPEKVILTTGELRITINVDEKTDSFLFNYKDKQDEFASSHRLYVNSEPNFTDIKVVEDLEAFTNEYISLWHLGKVKEGRIQLKNVTLKSERQLLEDFVNSHHLIYRASEAIYSSYCPNCKNKNLHFVEGYYRCPDCGSIYKFMKNKGGKGTNVIVFANSEN